MLEWNLLLKDVVEGHFFYCPQNLPQQWNTGNRSQPFQLEGKPSAEVHHNN